MRSRIRGVLAAFSLAACAFATAGEPTQLAPLHIIPTENVSPELIAADGPVRVRLVSPDAQGLAPFADGPEKQALAGVVEFCIARAR